MSNATDSLAVIALAGDAEVALYRLHGSSAKLELLHRLRLPGAEGSCSGVPLAATNGLDRIYVAWRGEPYQLFTLALDRQSGQLVCLAAAPLPASMCHASVSACGQHVLTSSNQGSVVAVSPLDKEGIAGEPALVQEAFKSHCLVEAPSGQLHSASLRGDFVQSYTFDATRMTLSPSQRLDRPTGSGPRHIVFDAAGHHAYLLSEFAGTLTSMSVDPDSGGLTPLHEVAMLGKDEVPWAAELRLGAGDEILYASERASSQLFAYRLGDGGDFTRVAAVPAPTCPRAFMIDPSGKVLIALGETSGEAWTYRIRPDGAPELAARLHVGGGPSWGLTATDDPSIGRT